MDKTVTPAMRYRMGLNFDRLDSRKSYIGFAYSDDLKQGVFVSTPRFEPGGEYQEHWLARLSQKVDEAWRERYGCALPDEIGIDHIETIFAKAIRWMPETGLRKLSEDEAEITREVCNTGNDFTLDMLFLLVEGLGWTLGKPVPFNDPGWLAIWAEEEDCGGYMAVICNVLRMDYPEYDGIFPVMPEVVARAYAATPGP